MSAASIACACAYGFFLDFVSEKMSYQQARLLVSGSFGTISEDTIIRSFEKVLRENDENDIEDIDISFNF